MFEPLVFVAVIIGTWIASGYFTKRYNQKKLTTCEILERSLSKEVHGSVCNSYIWVECDLNSISDYYTLVTHSTDSDVNILEARGYILFNTNGHIVLVKSVSDIIEDFILNKTDLKEQNVLRELSS